MTDQKALPFTGERFTPECKGRIWHEHWHRYLFVAELARGKRVLDAACGEGYGSAFIARTAGQVIGADLDPVSIAHAETRYRKIANLRFLAASVTSLPLEDASVDLVVSFETIEHLAEQDAMLAEFRRVLTADGCLILSSPNRPVYSDQQHYSNEYHVREMDRKELEDLLAPHFPQSRWFAQRFLFQSMVWSLESETNAMRGETHQYSSRREIPIRDDLDPMYYLVACGGASAQLAELPDFSVLAEKEQAVDHDPRGAYLQALAQQAEIADLEDRLRNVTAGEVNKPGSLAEVITQCSRQEQQAQRILELEERVRYRESFVGWLKYPLSVLKRKILNRSDGET